MTDTAFLPLDMYPKIEVDEVGIRDVGGRKTNNILQRRRWAYFIAGVKSALSTLTWLHTFLNALLIVWCEIPISLTWGLMD
uniref:Uncharacterized protein n=1 Tax=Lepeophtheirus salmonis TaxID=72036 RepID=A0A0K2UKR8_LEPSM